MQQLKIYINTKNNYCQLVEILCRRSWFSCMTDSFSSNCCSISDLSSWPIFDDFLCLTAAETRVQISFCLLNWALQILLLVCLISAIIRVVARSKSRTDLMQGVSRLNWRWHSWRRMSLRLSILTTVCAINLGLSSCRFPALSLLNCVYNAKLLPTRPWNRGYKSHQQNNAVKYLTKYFVYSF